MPLERRHRVDDFRCSSSEQQDWLQRFARPSHAAESTRVFVVTVEGADEVVAYFAWRMAELTVYAAPGRLRAGSGRYPQPVALLARLAVHTDHGGRGLGSALLRDVVLRLLDLDPTIGCRGLLIHAESEAARAWYLHVVPELMASPTDPMHLVLLLKDVRRSLQADW
ncbi:MAG: GNAT family N-acetyltransferase [Actinobacteria bacterium]|nr:GNAT family N-acetyltransferase [Actinomycetota bacterium]